MAAKTTARAKRLKAEARAALAWEICIAAAPLAALAMVFAVLSQSHGGF